MFNDMWCFGTFLEKCREVVLFKSPRQKMIIANYSPIALTYILYKLTEKFTYKRYGGSVTVLSS